MSQNIHIRFTLDKVYCDSLYLLSEFTEFLVENFRLWKERSTYLYIQETELNGEKFRNLRIDMYLIFSTRQVFKIRFVRKEEKYHDHNEIIINYTTDIDICNFYLIIIIKFI